MIKKILLLTIPFLALIAMWLSGFHHSEPDSSNESTAEINWPANTPPSADTSGLKQAPEPQAKDGDLTPKAEGKMFEAYQEKVQEFENRNFAGFSELIANSAELNNEIMLSTLPYIKRIQLTDELAGITEKLREKYPQPKAVKYEVRTEIIDGKEVTIRTPVFND